MKPIKLIMSAFGSYADEICIDFTNSEHGIFLITGDTGAGKTTIFDAICYALYDKTSGGAREGSDMRSQYADPDVATFVEYTFSYGEDIYKIRRNPKYTRVSKRKDKEGNYRETTEQPGVELCMPDGRVFQGKIKETNEKIVEIIGLDAEQFTQIVMIAQGEFMKLLQAPSNKRKEIFGRIFNTKIYWQLQEGLRSKTKEVYGELEDNRKLCEATLHGIKHLPDEESYEIDFSEVDSEGIIELIDELLKKGKAKEKECEKDLKIIQENLEKKIVLLNSGKENNKLFDDLEKVRQEKTKLEGQADSMTVYQNDLLLAKKALNVEKEENLFKKASNDIEICNNKLKVTKTEFESAKLQLETFEKTKEETLKIKEQNEASLQNEINMIEQTLPAYKEADEHINRMQTIDKQLIKCEKDCVLRKESLDKMQAELVLKHQKTTDYLNKYQHKNDIFIASMAGIMAKELVQGMPCPVCGSKSHPCKADLPEDSVSQLDVNQSKSDWLEADEEERRYTDKISKLSGDLEELRTKLVKLQGTKQTILVQYNVIKEKLIFENEAAAVFRVDQLKKQLSKIVLDAKNAEDNWHNAKEKTVEITGRINELNKNSEQLLKETQNAKNQFEESLKKNGFASEKDYLTKKLSDVQMSNLEKRIADYHERCSLVQGELKLLESQIKGKDKIDIDSIQIEINELERNKKQQDLSHKNLYSINQTNKDVKDKVKSLLERRIELKQCYTVYGNLDKTANGNLSGVAKLDFQTFIQRRYFEIMIREANKRLVKMTNNQFILQCRSLDKLGSQGAVGLDIDVYSIVNDKTRDVKTLSGGESFMAALSMALGMSDVIQNTAGKVRMDTMFVDEGFGSLDDESRNEAIKILMELAGDRRLVGIISHVTELKEQIDNKLIVEKDERGSKAYWIK